MFYDLLEVDENGAARVLLTQDILENIRLRMLKQQRLLGHLVELILLRAWAIFVEQADGHFRVRMREGKDHSINEIAKQHDGGGHPLASGANSYSQKKTNKYAKRTERGSTDSPRLRKEFSWPFIC